MSIDAVVFDLDGTLLDTLEDIRSALNEGLRANGFPQKDLEHVRRSVGSGLARLVQLSVPEETGEQTRDRILADLKRSYSEHLSDFTVPYAGMPELLSKIREHGLKAAMVSNKAEEAALKLADLWFPGLLDSRVGESAAMQRKPHPAMVRAALEQMGAEAERTAYVGDSDVDVRTAANAGCPFIGVLWGYRTREQLEDAGAEVFARDVAELDRLIGEMSGRW